MKILSFLLRVTDLFEKAIAVGRICILFITAGPLHSKIMETTKNNMLLSAKSDISYAANSTRFIIAHGKRIEMKYGYPSARSITNIIDLSDFDVSYYLDYIDIRIDKDDNLFLRYFPNEDDPLLKLYKSDHLDDLSV